ncbi:MAG: DUF177 domain-containing protein [Lachnospiraceae bacterium]|nr:DUF177 domain-containing protein [Lachnospiraceae bacterium]
MLINLSDVLTKEGKTLKAQADIEMSEFVGGFGTFKITGNSGVDLDLSFNGVNEALLKGKSQISFSAPCDRCLKDTTVVLDLDFEYVIHGPEFVGEDEEDDDQKPFIDGYYLDTEALINNEILVNWPLKILCKEDCKGVCPVCGQDLNEKQCGCDTFVPDPRMAKFQDIFNANKEV